MKYRTLNILRKKLGNNVSDRILFPVLKDNKEIILEFNSGKDDNKIHFEILDDDHYFDMFDEITYDEGFVHKIKRVKVNEWSSSGKINGIEILDPSIKESKNFYINPLELKLKGSIIREGNIISFNRRLSEDHSFTKNVSIYKKGEENYITRTPVPIKITLEEI